MARAFRRALTGLIFAALFVSTLMFVAPQPRLAPRIGQRRPRPPISE